MVKEKSHMVKEIRIEDFDYNLPDERIPRHPLAQRDACRLLLSRPDGIVSHRRFSELPDLLPPGTMLVCNDTRVINARISFHKATGSRIEVFLLEPLDPSDYVLTFQTRSRCVWSCLVGNLKRWKEGPLELKIRPEGFAREFTLTARRLQAAGGNAHAIEFSWDNPEATFATVVEAAGFIPIPPYLKRESEESDLSDYQTIYADAKGSVAAPTAGLHFTPGVFASLDAHNIPVGKLTLHVGAGTFQPVKAETIGDHPMHTETFTISRSLLADLIAQKRTGHPLAAVGTTSVRTLESLPVLGALLMRGDESLHVGQWDAYTPEVEDIDTVAALEALLSYMERGGLDAVTASTAIMIAPGFKWRMTDIMVTNFHQPQSTLLLLVSSFLGGEDYTTPYPRWRRIYEEALDGDYRFLSYGDACLLFRRAERGVSKRYLPTVALPASKSIGARYLVASFMAGGITSCRRFDGCDDLKVMQNALLLLDKSVKEGSGSPATIDVHASGTALRFMTAAAASTPGADIILTGTPRLLARPMAPLIDVLLSAGASVEALGANGNGPYRICGRKLRGGRFTICGDVSSQFISALMLAAPVWQGGLRLSFSTPLVSRPYAVMTARVMEAFGVETRLTDEGVEVREGAYRRPAGFRVEPDWSAAGFIYEAAAFSLSPIKIAGLVSPGESLQGDSATADIFRALGVVTEFTEEGAIIERREELPDELTLDLADHPDLVPALALGCAYNACRFRFTGVRNLRLKESDRLEALKIELGKYGYPIKTGDDFIAWEGGIWSHDDDFTVATYGDHRIAMAFAIGALRRFKVRIADPDVVEKSYARFWEQLPAMGLECRREDDVMFVEDRDTAIEKRLKERKKS